MKIAVSTYSLHRWRADHGKTLRHTLELIAELGAQGVEFVGLTDPKHPQVEHPFKRAAKLRRRAEKLGLTVCGYCVGANLMAPPDEQKKTVKQLKQEVEIAAELGCKSVRHDVGWGFDRYKDYKGPRTFAAALKLVVPAIREVCEHGLKHRIATSLENHGFFFQSPDRVEQLIRAVRHRNYGLTLDTGNFLCVHADPVAAVKRLARYALHVHVKDFHLKKQADSPGEGWFNTPNGTALRGAILGHGVIDVPAQLQLLKRAGYRGYLSLEFEGLEDPPTALRLGLEYLRKHLARG